MLRRWFRRNRSVLAVVLVVYVLGLITGWSGYGAVDEGIDTGIPAVTVTRPAAAVAWDWETTPDPASVLGNNLLVSVVIWLGWPLLGSLSLAVVFWQGVNHALITRIVLESLPPAAVAAGLLPHGLLETASLLCSGAVGLHLLARLWRHLRGGKWLEREDGQDLALSFILSVVLLVVAALVETVVTPHTVAWALESGGRAGANLGKQ